MKKTTVKKIKEWLKTLEENRYKKRYMSDARRIAWFVNNNLSEDYEAMPISLRKKWPKAQYQRERFLAKKFSESLTQNESILKKIRNLIREEIQGLNGR
tara:strand:- start:385 stop:681 length:297 start_codon:yes stop_codon:yes gene_type:complete